MLRAARRRARAGAPDPSGRADLSGATPGISRNHGTAARAACCAATHGPARTTRDRRTRRRAPSAPMPIRSDLPAALADAFLAGEWTHAALKERGWATLTGDRRERAAGIPPVPWEARAPVLWDGRRRQRWMAQLA